MKNYVGNSLKLTVDTCDPLYYTCKKLLQNIIVMFFC